MASKAIRNAKEEQQELEALHRLDEECVYQQQAGNYLKAFDCMERALVLRRHFFGADSPEVLHACKALAEMCNLLAMSFLQQDNYAVTIDLLKKAEILTKHHASEKATTLNNLACYYRRLGKLHAAMACLKRALELEKKLQNVRNTADTHLNICAVLSQLGKHQQALEQAQEALIILQEEFFQSKQTMAAIEKPTGISKKLPSQGQEAGGEGDKASASSSGQQLDRVSVMCIAYHNIGVEQEFLKDYANSVVSYKKGVGLAEQYLGVDHAITTTVRNSYLAAKRTISTKSAGSKHSPLSKSPGKASTRLISSPRSNGNGSLTNSLRLPSPLSEEKQRHNIGDIPTPRSIVADVLSKGATLPPLDAKSSFKSVLSPRDPFFSSRFRFDEDNGSGAGSVKKSPGSAKKKRKEVKFQSPAADEAEEAPIAASNNLSPLAVELGTSAEDSPAVLVEPLIGECNQDSPIVSQGSVSDHHSAHMLAGIADSEAHEPSGDKQVGERGTLSETDLTQAPMMSALQEEEPRSPPSVDSSHSIEANSDDMVYTELTNSEELTEADDKSLPPEPERSANSKATETEADAESTHNDESLLTQEDSSASASPPEHALQKEAEAGDIVASDSLTEEAAGSPSGNATAPKLVSDSKPDALVSVVEAAGGGEALKEAITETEGEHDKEDILGLLDGSTGDLHLAEAEGDTSEPTELPANPTDLVAAENEVEAISITEEAGGVESDKIHFSMEETEASDSPPALATVHEDSVPHEDDTTATEEQSGREEFAAAADSEDPPLSVNQSAPTSEPIENADVSGFHDHIESSSSEAAHSESQLHPEGEVPCSLPEEPLELTWAAGHARQSDGYTTAENDELHSGNDTGVDHLDYNHPEPGLRPDDSSGYLSAFEREEFVPAGESYNREVVSTTEYEYHHQADTEATHDSAIEEHYERHPSPDPEYDDQFEHETVPAEHEEGHLHAYSDPSHAGFQESPPEAAFYTEDGYSIEPSEDQPVLEGYTHDDLAPVESELALEHYPEVESGSHVLTEAAAHDHNQFESGHVDGSNTVEL